VEARSCTILVPWLFFPWGWAASSRWINSSSTGAEPHHPGALALHPLGLSCIILVN